MNQDVASRLPAARRAEYLALTRMIESDGFKYLVRRLHVELESAQARKDNASSWEQNRVAHGEVGVYQTLIELDEAIENEFFTIAFTESDEEHE